MRRFALVVAIVAGLAAATASSALANHSWGNYHWARAANPFTVPLGDSVSNTAYSNWDGALSGASADWTSSSVLDAPIVAGGGGNVRNCRGTDGRIRVCNATYGNNGWLGLAQIWLSGSHIVRGTAKMNDTYFNSTSYSYTNERHVMCQEVGHGFGLDHQDTSGADLNTCMDYSNALDNPSPNAHDYEQLQTIYGSHVDAGAGPSFAPGRSEPVKVTRTDTISTSEFVSYYGNGYQVHTLIVWALGS
ncbi:MAG: hypothetical protein ABI896_04105 [Actinomycetota bacterium]